MQAEIRNLKDAAGKVIRWSVRADWFRDGTLSDLITPSFIDELHAALKALEDAEDEAQRKRNERNLARRKRNA